MARVDISQIKRAEVHNLVIEAHRSGRGAEKAEHVRTELTRRYPGIETVTVRRNGRVYTALDYLVEDLGSYGTSS